MENIITSERLGTYTTGLKSVLGAMGTAINNAGGSSSMPVVTVSGTEVTQQLDPNKIYSFGEVTSLTITLGTPEADKVNQYIFEFDSGATATTLTLPNNIKWDVPVVINEDTHYTVGIDYSSGSLTYRGSIVSRKDIKLEDCVIVHFADASTSKSIRSSYMEEIGNSGSDNLGLDFAYFDNMYFSKIPTHITIENGDAYIGFKNNYIPYRYFYGVKPTSITIPSNIKRIGVEAFFSSTSTYIDYIFLSTIPPKFESQANLFNSSYARIYVPSKSVNAYKTALSTYSSRIFAIQS